MNSVQNTSHSCDVELGTIQDRWNRGATMCSNGLYVDISNQQQMFEVISVNFGSFEVP